MVAQVVRPAGQVVRGVGEFEHARDDVGQVGFGVAVGGEDGELLEVIEAEVNPTNFLACYEIERQASKIG